MLKYYVAVLSKQMKKYTDSFVNLSLIVEEIRFMTSSI